MLCFPGPQHVCLYEAKFTFPNLQTQEYSRLVFLFVFAILKQHMKLGFWNKKLLEHQGKK